MQYWHDEAVPDDVEQMFATFLVQNPGFRHLVFDESSAEELIASHFGAAEAEAFRACGAPAMQADYFRYCAVYVLGGIYCDADCRCVAPLAPLLERDGGEIFVGRERDHVHNDFFVFASPRHPFLRLVVDIATTNIEHRVWNRVWIATGQGILAELLRMRRAGSVDKRLDLFRRSPYFAGDPQKLRYLDAVRKVVDDARVGTAFEGIRISPRTKARQYVMHGGAHLAYKQTQSHYANYTGSIYRA